MFPSACPDCEGTGTHKDKHRSEARITTVPDVDRGAEEASAMNDYEILRVIDFIERTREPFAKLMPVSDEEPIWKVIACLIKSEIKGQIVTASALAHVSGAPFSTARRLIA